MLQGITWASPPAFLMPAATSSQASTLRLEITTLAPSFASSSAEERPMPRLEPVMTATFPVRSNGVPFTAHSLIVLFVALFRHARACPGHPRTALQPQDVDGRVKPGPRRQLSNWAPR